MSSDSVVSSICQMLITEIWCSSTLCTVTIRYRSCSSLSSSPQSVCVCPSCIVPLVLRSFYPSPPYIFGLGMKLKREAPPSPTKKTIFFSYFLFIVYCKSAYLWQVEVLQSLYLAFSFEKIPLNGTLSGMSITS